MDLQALNTSHGIASTLMEKLVDCTNWERAWDETFLHDANACANHAHQKMTDASRLMVGVFIAAGHHELGAAALEKVRACVELKHQKELGVIWKRDEEEEKLQQKVLAVCEKEEAHWTAGDVWVSKLVQVTWWQQDAIKEGAA